MFFVLVTNVITNTYGHEAREGSSFSNHYLLATTTLPDIAPNNWPIYCGQKVLRNNILFTDENVVHCM